MVPRSELGYILLLADVAHRNEQRRSFMPQLPSARPTKRLLVWVDEVVAATRAKMPSIPLRRPSF
jgi:hypothetical protein